MKLINLYLILLLLFIVHSKPKLRNLWEEAMEYKERNSDELDSLIHCSKSNYKYFSFILNGAPVTFEHFVGQDNVVR